ncbi:DUF1120 domain-containing protein [Pseudomonas sp. 24 R 17]|uniref:DUF1120 domain-containing protein n=1 Tax=Pseudomonas sp. 24 R 17 TaxID=1844096 RepID=UPI00081214FF|nr:DUF1120 domain-containing protein [Pseudomonas sp. 24 R 17]CRL96967.1 hypothetical protein [Pseudomonas sp. 24 R 17]
MSKSLPILVATLAMACAAQTQAASAIDLSVSGLITPSACELNLANGGQFEVGKIASKDLYPEQPTDLPSMTTALTVTCEAATLVAIETQDNRAGSAYFDDAQSLGLGLINGNQKLGNMYVVLRSILADGDSGYGIHSNDGGLTWNTGGYFRNGGLVSIYKASPLMPVPVQVLTASMQIDAAIAPSKNLTLTSEVPIDGSATLTVRYL